MPSILALQPQVNRRRTISHEHSSAGRPAQQQQHKPPSSWTKVVPHARKLSLRLVGQRRQRPSTADSSSQRAGMQQPNSMATADEIINILYHPAAANSASADLRHRGELSRPPPPPDQQQGRPRTRQSAMDPNSRRLGDWDELLRIAQERAPDAPPQSESARRAQADAMVPPNVLLADVPGTGAQTRRRHRRHRGVNRDPRATAGVDAPPAYALMDKPPSYQHTAEEVTPWMQRGESLTGALALGGQQNTNSA